MIAWLQSYGPLILLVALTIDRVAERIFPNATLLKSIDAKLSSLGIKDVDGK